MNRQQSDLHKVTHDLNKVIRYCESHLEEHYVPGASQRVYGDMLDCLVAARNMLDVMLVEAKGLDDMQRTSLLGYVKDRKFT